MIWFKHKTTIALHHLHILNTIRKFIKVTVSVRNIFTSATLAGSHFEPDFSPSLYLSSKYDRCATEIVTRGRERNSAHPSDNVFFDAVCIVDLMIIADISGTCLYVSLSTPSLYVSIAASRIRNDGRRILCEPRSIYARKRSSRLNCITQWGSGQSKVTDANER